MRPASNCSGWSLVVLFGLQLSFAEERTISDATPEMVAAQHVQTAIQFQLGGEIDYANRLLQLALRVDPDSPAAHWQLKQVKSGDAWVDVRRQATDIRQQELETEYGLLRDKSLGDPKLEASLATWSQRNSQSDRARLHFRRVLANQAATENLVDQALKQLNVQWYRGELKTLEEVADIERAQVIAERAIKKGRPQFEKWRDAIEKRTRREQRARQAVQSIADVEFIPVIESFLSDSGPEFGRELVDALGRRNNSFSATEALVRFAVLSPWHAVRHAAAQKLRDRPLHDFVPTLIEGLSSPIVSRFYISRDGRGGVRYQHHVTRREADGDYVTNSDHVSRHERVVVKNGAVIHGGPLQRNPTYDAGAEKTEMARLARVAQERERQLHMENQRVEAENSLVYAALEIATGAGVVRSAPEWRQWWTAYYTETSGEQPVYQSYEPSTSTYYTVSVLEDSTTPYDPPKNVVQSGTAQRRRRSVRSNRNGSMSCFAAGTPVWTERGLVSIEEIKVGDRVLSQDPNTGELAYKVVLVPTAGAPSTEMVRVSFGEDAVRLTRSHVIWKQGVGWQMAKEIQAGDQLYGITDGMSVRQSEAWPRPQLVYNLVVEDFQTYFVGKHGLLVHDITPRSPTSAKVPGMAAVDDKNFALQPRIR